MNLVEILKAQGISDEVIKAVQTEMKNNKNPSRLARKTLMCGTQAEG